MKPILILEVNEVPWRLIDYFQAMGRFPHIARFFGSSKTYETVAVDSGELSPWITWPTLYRGIPQSEHGIRFLGQDPATFQGTPIWQEYRNRGLSIGICGTLQSWPPANPGRGGFYVPDTFAHSAECIPHFVEAFQKYNLRQVSENGRVVDAGSLFTRELLDLVISLPRLGIRSRTLARVAGQLIGERFHPERVARRATFQSILLWDVFNRLFDCKAPPSFSSYFTNHIAGVMHRYWHHVFPEDFEQPGETINRVHLDTMFFAIQFLDELLKRAMKFCESNPELTVVFASSMGQAAMVWENRDGYAFAIKDLSVLFEKFGLVRSDFQTLLAMVPQVAATVLSDKKRDKTRTILEACRTSSGEQLFFVETLGSTLSITVRTPSFADIQSGCFSIGDRKLTWEESGIKVHQVETGSAYHVPEGVLATYSKRQNADSSRRQIKVTEVKTLLMEIGGLAL